MASKFGSKWAALGAAVLLAVFAILAVAAPNALSAPLVGNVATPGDGATGREPAIARRFETGPGALEASGGAAAGEASATTIVSGAITVPTTWSKAESPYLLTTDVTVTAGVTLTILPGVVVQGEEAVELIVLGHLSALGTAAEPITFTSSADTGPNQWSGLVFDGGSGHLRYATVRYGGNPCSFFTLEGTNIAARDVVSGELRIEHSQIRDSYHVRPGCSGACQVFDYGVYAENSRIIISNTTFTGNGRDAVGPQDAALEIRGSSVVSVVGSSFLTNTGEGLHAMDNATVSISASEFQGHHQRLGIPGPQRLRDPHRGRGRPVVVGLDSHRERLVSRSHDRAQLPSGAVGQHILGEHAEPIDGVRGGSAGGSGVPGWNGSDGRSVRGHADGTNRDHADHPARHHNPGRRVRPTISPGPPERAGDGGGADHVHVILGHGTQSMVRSGLRRRQRTSALRDRAVRRQSMQLLHAGGDEHRGPRRRVRRIADRALADPRQLSRTPGMLGGLPGIRLRAVRREQPHHH